MKSAGALLGTSGFAEGSRCLGDLFRANCKMRLVSACLCWRDTLLWSAKNFFAETVSKLLTTISKPSSSVQRDETCACFASVGPRSLSIGLQRFSKPSTMTLKLNSTQPRSAITLLVAYYSKNEMKKLAEVARTCMLGVMYYNPSTSTTPLPLGSHSLGLDGVSAPSRHRSDKMTSLFLCKGIPNLQKSCPVLLSVPYPPPAVPPSSSWLNTDCSSSEAGSKRTTLTTGNASVPPAAGAIYISQQHFTLRPGPNCLKLSHRTSIF